MEGRRRIERQQFLDTIRQVIVTGQPAGDAGPDDVEFILSGFNSWLCDHLTLRTLGVPVHEVRLTAENSLNDSVSVRSPNQKMLPHFIATELVPFSARVGFIPPYFLKIHKEFFSWENNQTFVNFLTSRYTTGLVGMSMSIPKNGGSMNFPFRGTLFFPAMRELNILFSNQGTEIVDGCNDRFVPFIQRILNATIQLEKLVFSYCRNASIPNGLPGLRLPASLSSLYLSCELTSEQFAQLADSDQILPNLNHFGLLISTHTLPHIALYRILRRVKRTLERLYFYGIKYDDRSRPRGPHVSHFLFPLMESLQFFFTSSIHAELVVGLGPLQVALPKLKQLCLRNQTKIMFYKWTHNSLFPNVTNLAVGVVNDRFRQQDSGHHISLSGPQIRSVHRVFPNLTILNITVAEEEDGLRWLLTGTLRLKELKLVVKTGAIHNDSNKWDSLLVGVTLLGGIQALMAHPLLFLDRNFNPNVTSIRKFTALQCLTLSAPFLPDIDIEQQGPLISDAVFFFAFLLMPNLNRLHLAGRFWATAGATEAWQSLGRTIIYTAQPVDRDD